jgi:hypothetical protein
MARWYDNDQQHAPGNRQRGQVAWRVGALPMHDVGNPELIIHPTAPFFHSSKQNQDAPNRSATQFTLIPALPMMQLWIKLKTSHKNLIYTKNRRLFAILVMPKANGYQYIALRPAVSRTGTFGTIAGREAGRVTSL